MGILYFIIGMFATIFGAMAGLGGGVIIKPVLDLLNDYDVGTIGILSASTVFAMACVSLITSRNNKVKINIRSSLTLAVGSIIGGITGKFTFNFLMQSVHQADVISILQSAMIGILMIVIYIFVKRKQSIRTYQLTNLLLVVAIGFSLGMLAAFLGIGGGPFNVAILALCFSMGPKEAALNSIFIIFFSQLSSLLLTAFLVGFASFDLSMLGYMVTGGIVGGFTGSKISSYVNDHQVERIFTIGIIGIIIISIWNIIRHLF